MAVIIEITDSKVLVGTDDGGIREFSHSDLHFYPRVGDEVLIFENEDKVCVVKTRSTEPQKSSESFTFSIPKPQRPNNPVELDNGQVSVNKVIYCLLCILLGGFGAHKFYVHRIGTGVLYLLFCWTVIPFIIAAVEFCIVLGIPADENGMIII